MASGEGSGERLENDPTEEDILRELEDQVQTSRIAAEVSFRVVLLFSNNIFAPGNLD